MANLVRSSINALYGSEAIVPVDNPSMGGEDFSVYLDYVPGALFFTGIRNEDTDSIYSLHHPKFTIDEAVLSRTSAVLAQIAVDYLGESD